MNRAQTCLLLLAFALLVSGCPMTPPPPPPPPSSGGEATLYSATLDGDQSTGDVVTDGSGTASFTLNAAQTELTFDITAADLTGPVTLAHFHNAAVGQDGDVVFSITDTVTEANGAVTASGTWPMTASDVVELLAGNIYVNLHTDAFPPGELRGQVLPAE